MTYATFLSEADPAESVSPQDAPPGWATPPAIDAANAPAAAPWNNVLQAQRLADQDSARALRQPPPAAPLATDGGPTAPTPKFQWIKGRDLFGKAGVPIIDDGTTVQPVMDRAGQPLTHDDARNNVAWDSIGQPQALDDQP